MNTRIIQFIEMIYGCELEKIKEGTIDISIRDENIAITLQGDIKTPTVNGEEIMEISIAAEVTTA